MSKGTEFVRMVKNQFEEVDKFYNENNVSIPYEEFVERYFSTLRVIAQDYVDEANYSQNEGRMWYYGY